VGNIKTRTHSKGGLRIVAIFEATKGILVLVVGFELLRFIHQDLHLAAEQLVRHMHINPARHYPRIFIDAANHLNDTQLLVMAFSALLYTVVRFVEAFGLWKQLQWAQWFALLTGGMYIPVEVFEIMSGMTWPKATVLIVNAAIVIYMAYVLYRSREKLTHVEHKD
jgi:uncharacterized membrane protein (DUF2068 family)